MKKIKKTLSRSKKPGKQRLLVAKAPLHIRKNFVRCRLSKELQKTYNKRNLQVRKGDEVKVMRGQFKGKTGKVAQVLLKKTKLIIDGMDNIKTDGSKSPYPIHPSNVMITKIGSDDKKRKKVMERK
ncbi:MAG: 50S ribosomal protein L24 [archaeon]